MGKAKLSPKKDANQKKISSFFTKGASGSGSNTSNLFSHVGGKARSKLSVSKSKLPSTSKSSPIVISDDAPRHSSSKGTSASHSSTKSTSASHSSIKSTSEKPEKPVTPVKITEGADAELIPDTPGDSFGDFSDLVPDTPDASESLLAQKRKIPQARSFLSSSNILKTGGGPTVKPKISETSKLTRVIKSAKRSSLSSSDKQSKSLSGSIGSWDTSTSNSNLDAVLMDNGLPSVQKTTAAEKTLTEKLRKSDNNRMAGNIALRGKMIAEAALKNAPMKRTASGSTGESPNPKRCSLNPENCMETETSINPGEEAMDFVPETQLPEDDKPRKSFQWERKKKSTKAAASPVKEDHVLSDILNEIKESDIKTECVPNAPPRKANVANIPECATTSTPKTLLSAKDMDTFAANEKLADDALTDIMGELKESLSKQNQLSAQGKKVGRPSNSKKIFRRRLSLADEENLSEKENGTKQTPPEKKSPIKTSPKVVEKKNPKETLPAEATLPKHKGFLSAESSQDSLDPLVAENKAGALLMEDDSWLEDVDLGAVEGALSKDFSLLSPYKDQDGTKRDPDDPVYQPHHTLPPCHAFGRYKVLDVQHISHNELMLMAESVTDHVTRQVSLTGFWCDTQVQPGDIVHIIGAEDGSSTTGSGPVTVSDTSKLVVLNPDLLISGTSVVSSVHCVRRAVLNEKFKGMERSGNVYMLNGSAAHALFQEAVRGGGACGGGANDIRAIAAQTARNPRFLADAYGLGLGGEELENELMKCVPLVERFLKRHVRGNGNDRPSADIVIEDIADIEENIWSPRFGVKGKIDLTVKVKIHSDRGKTTVEKVMPLELKTGKASYSIEHKGQVTLYSMMSSDRRDDPHSGLLLYLREGEMKTIPANHSNQRGLIQLRNELAFYLSTSMKQQGKPEGKPEDKQEGKQDEDVSWPFGPLPPPINNPRSCGKCPQLINCAAYQRSVECVAPPAPGHAMAELVPHTLRHLNAPHLHYYTCWLHLLHLEASTCHKRQVGVSQLWCKTGWQREQEGECLSGMVLQENQCRQHDSERHLQVFRRHPKHISEVCVDAVGITKGDSVVVSAENQPLIALSMGYVHRLAEDGAVVLLLDRDLRQYTQKSELIFRLDKADTYNTMAINFTNIARLMENTAQCEKLRELIIDRRAPKFDLTLSKSSLQAVKHIFKSLNRPQKTAILKVLMSQDYVQIKGYPGTGKTSTIVALVRVLVSLGQSVLLTSYTHSAVDNILLKLLKHGVDFVRLGRVERIHDDIRPYSAELLTKTIDSVPKLAQFYASKAVVATTCLGTTHPIFQQRTFDVCIVDEASQVLQPACLGPLFVSSRFVLVGDPLQLPPVVQSAEARDRGMADSLFVRLDDTGGTYELNLQYRMNSTIQRLSNELVYDGALKCGTESVAASRLQLNTSDLASFPHWIERALGGSEVQFLDTDAVARVKDESESSIKNVLEGKIVLKLIGALIKANVPAEDIGVISPYREQVTYLRDLTQKASRTTQFPDARLVEVNTVDQYQGRDKSVIIVSFVKEETGATSGILRDTRRLNVALTRARHKLLLVGSRRGLLQYSPFVKIFQILQTEQMNALPEDAVADNME